MNAKIKGDNSNQNIVKGYQWEYNGLLVEFSTRAQGTVVSTKSDSDVILCLELQSKTLSCTLHLT